MFKKVISLISIFILLKILSSVMNICVIGAGIVGSFISEKLAKEGHQVKVVDINNSSLEKLSLKANILPLNCDISSLSCISRCSQCETYLILTNNDELNLSIAQYISKILGKSNILVRIHKEIYSELCKKLELNCINILKDTIENLNLLLKYPFASSVWEIAESLLVFELKLNKTNFFVNKTLKDLSDLRKKFNFSVILIKRGKNFIIPKGSTLLQEKDEVFIAIEKPQLKDFLREISLTFQPVKTLYILGFSEYAAEWFPYLNKTKGLRVKFFDASKEICYRVSQDYENIEVFNIPLTEEAELLEEGILEANYVWCMDEKEEKNLINALFVKNLGVKKVGILLKQPQYEKFILSLGIDAYILPKKIAASKIYSVLKGKKILKIIELAEGIDIFEYVYEGEEKTLKNFRDHKCSFIIFIKRNGNLILPKGDTVLLKGDILICLRKI